MQTPSLLSSGSGPKKPRYSDTRHTKTITTKRVPIRRLNHEKTNEKLDLCGIVTSLRKKNMEKGVKG